MRFNHPLSPVIIGVTMVLVAPQVATALSAVEVNQIAEGITVRIDSNAPGSGVILKKSGNKYTVLTAHNVVSKKNLTYKIVTPDGENYDLDRSKIKPLPNVDLALIEFTSRNNYNVAKLGNSDHSQGGTISYLGGFPGTNYSINEPTFTFTQGKIAANSKQPLNDGYALIYNNSAVGGMSGGPVLNEKGELIGIHGRGDVRYDERTEDNIISDFKLGIPINTFLRLASQDRLYAEVTAPPARASTPLTAEDFFVRGVNKHEKGDNNGAIADLKEAIKLNPKYAEAFFKLGNARIAFKTVKASRNAVADYTEAIKLNPKYFQAYYNRGLIRGRDLKDYQGAIADFSQAIKLNPQLDQAYTNRGLARSLLKDYQGAIKDYTQAIKINPNQNKAYYGRGNAYLELQDYQKANADYTQSIKIKPDYAPAYDKRSSVRRKLKDEEGADADSNQAMTLRIFQGDIATYSEAIEREPNDANAYYKRGIAYRELQNYQKAIKDLNQAIQLAPENAKFYYALGIVYHRQNSFDNAISQYQKAVVVDDKSWEAITKMGLIKYEQGDVEGATKEWQTALSMKNYSEPMLAFAVILNNQGEQEKAIAMAKDAISRERGLARVKSLQYRLWGKRLIADTQKFFALPEMQKFISEIKPPKRRSSELLGK